MVIKELILKQVVSRRDIH